MTVKELAPIDVTKFTVTENGNVIKPQKIIAVEELAEEYADTKVSDRKGYNARWELINQAYIAGYNKGRADGVVWHEIESKVSPKREISKQYMPKNKEKVLLKYHFSGDDEIHISDGYYDAYDFEFHITNNPKFRIVCVKAWTEM